MNKLLGVAAAIEAATGLALMIYPPILSRLLLGEGVFGAGIALGRIAGFALLSLGLACWPGIKPLDRNTPALRALLLYNLLATLYLAYLRDPWPTRWELVVARRRAPRRALAAARTWLAALRVARVKQQRVVIGA